MKFLLLKCLRKKKKTRTNESQFIQLIRDDDEMKKKFV